MVRLWSRSDLVTDYFRGKPATQVVVRDITDQKKLQNQLFQSQKIQSIGTLGWRYAHTNNILAIILGYSSTLEKEQEWFQKHAEGNCRYQSSNRSRCSTCPSNFNICTETDMAFKPLNIPDLVHELLSMLKRLFRRRLLYTNVRTDIPDILADRTQIHQTL